jgi:hypothetical protein
LDYSAREIDGQTGECVLSEHRYDGIFIGSGVGDGCPRGFAGSMGTATSPMLVRDDLRRAA